MARRPEAYLALLSLNVWIHRAIFARHSRVGNNLSMGLPQVFDLAPESYILA